MTSNIKYIGMDVHKESISIAVRNAVGKVVMESVIDPRAFTLRRESLATSRNVVQSRALEEKVLATPDNLLQRRNRLSCRLPGWSLLGVY